jgi:hypothetical protein
MKRLRISIAVLVAIAIVWEWSPSGAPAVQATSECLGLPTQAVEDWKDGYPCCFEEQVCARLCEQWSKTCQSFVTAAYQCLLKSSGEVLTLEKSVECDTQEDKDSKKECITSVDGDRRNLGSMLSEDLQQAKETCVESIDECIENCVGVPK